MKLGTWLIKYLNISSSEEFIDVEKVESPKNRKRNKYPVGQKKRRKKVISGLKRGKKSTYSHVSSNYPSSSKYYSETLTECLTVVNFGEKSSESANFDANNDNGTNVSHNNDASSSNNSSNNESEDGDSYIYRCQDEFQHKNLVMKLLQKFQSSDLLGHFMAFVHGICSGVVKLTNISILLALEYCYLMSLSNTTLMRYREDTCKFWESALAVGEPKLIRLFSYDKHFGQVNRRQCS